MTILSSPVLAEASKTSFEPLFGNQWLALLAIMVGVIAFLFAVAAVGRWLAATHPDEPARAPVAAAAPQPTDTVVDTAPSAEIFAAIAAAVAVTLGSKARIASINTIPISADAEGSPARLQWSMEGRRQIYSSHKVR